MKVSAHVVVGRSIDEVFAFATSVRYLDRWMKGITDPRWLTHAPNEAGARFACNFTFGGLASELVFEITEYERNERYDLRVLDGPFGLFTNTAFEPVSEGTVVRRTVDLYLTPIPVPIVETLGFLIRPMLAQRVRENLVRLKACIEGTDPTPGMGVATG